MLTLRLLPITATFALLSAVAFSQSPGGVSTANLTSWFKPDNQVFQNTAMTIPAVNGSTVLAWGDLTGNPQLPSVQKIGGGTITYTSVDAYFNFNPTMQIANAAFTRSVSGYNDIFSGTAGAAYYNVCAKGGMDLIYTFTSNGTSFPCGGNRCCTGFRGAVSQVTNVGTSYGSTVSNTKASIAGATSDYATVNQNNISGVLGGNNPGSFSSIATGYSYNIFNFPGYNGSGRVSENFTFNRSLSTNEVDRVESYLAIKYGVTLGTNGTSKNYLNSVSTVIWTQASNSAYAYDIAGIARDDNSALDQRKSHSVNNTALVFDDVVVIANGTNFSSPSALGSDRSAFVWGHNGQPASHSGWPVLSIPTDNAEIIQTIFQRKWKSQETGSVGTMTIEVDLSNVPGVGGVAGVNDLANLRLLVDEDGDFTTGATSISPSSFNNTTNIAYFQHDFLAAAGGNMTPLRGFFFTFGSVNAAFTPLPVALAEFKVSEKDCEAQIEWTTVSEQDSKEFVVEKSSDMKQWDEVCTVDAHGHSITPITYSCVDRSVEEEMLYYRLTQYDLDGGSLTYDFKSIAFDCNNVKPIVYPNPSNGIVYVNSPMEGTIVIQDMQGKHVLEHGLNAGNNKLNLEAVSAGVYFVSLELADNSIHVLRFFKE